MNDGCTHLDRIHDVIPSSWGCEGCLAQGRRDWVHLRVCRECGHAGCCDNSPGRHATAHFRLAGHPVVRSYEPGEDWYQCYLDQSVFELQGAPPSPGLRGPRHPPAAGVSAAGAAGTASPAR